MKTLLKYLNEWFNGPHCLTREELVARPEPEDYKVVYEPSYPGQKPRTLKEALKWGLTITFQTSLLNKRGVAENCYHLKGHDGVFVQRAGDGGGLTYIEL